jgi:hypothetical protein
MIKIHVEKLIVAQLGKKFCAFYGKQNLYYRVQESRPLVPISSPLNPVHALPCCFQKIHVTLPYTFLQLSLYFRFSDRNFACPTYLILLDLIMLIMCGEEHS